MKMLSLGIKGLGLVSALGIVLYAHYKSHPGEMSLGDGCFWAASWLRASLVTAAVTSGGAYFWFVGSLATPRHDANPDQFTWKVLRCGAWIGLGWAVLAILFAVFAFNAGDDAIHKGMMISNSSDSLLLLSILVIVVDTLLFMHRSECRKIITLDLLILFALAGTYIAEQWYYSRMSHHDSYVMGFVAGGMAFQVILANLLFSPSTFTLKNLLPDPDPTGVRSMNQTNKNLLWLLLILVPIFFVALYWHFTKPVFGPPVQRVTVGVATWPGFGTGFIGNEHSYFKDLEVTFKVIDDPAARHAAFQKGDISVMISSADVFAQELAQGINGSIFLVTDESAGADGIVAKATITRPEQLRHKRIAFARATPSQYFLYKLLQRSSLSPNTVKPVMVEDPGNAGQAFVGGSVDAAVTWEPLLTQIRESGKGHILATTRDFPETIVDVLVASPSLAGDDRLLGRFVEGWLRSVGYVQSQRQEAARVIGKGFNMPTDQAASAMTGVNFADEARNRYFLCSQGVEPSRLSTTLLDAARFWQTQGIISEAPKLDKGIIKTLCNIHVE